MTGGKRTIIAGHESIARVANLLECVKHDLYDHNYGGILIQRDQIINHRLVSIKRKIQLLRFSSLVALIYRDSAEF